ncbi:MAG: SurA N-terminal domain-containing protein [Halioglobus sp.]
MELQREVLAATLAPETASRAGQSLLLLATGAALGLVFALLNLLGVNSTGDLDASAVARVNGTQLELAEYERALQLLASEKRNALTGNDRSLVLERMIEEELLVQYGVTAGLVRTNRAVRTEALQSVITGLTVELEARSSEPHDQKTPAQERDDRLTTYLGQLRDAATIRWAPSSPPP